MPYVDLHPPSGHIKVFYYISTPESHSADEILPGIPTVLFLHPSGVASQIFESQWADPDLRRFNLVGFDMRAHGLTTGCLKSGPISIVEDVRHFMDALNIASCHIFALSAACDTALQLASNYPQRVLSMTFCSPAPRQDDESVIEARLEMFQSWRDSFAFLPSKTGRGNRVVIHQEMINEVIAGFKQFSFNMSDSPLAKAVSDVSLQQSFNSMTPQILDETYRLLVESAQRRQRISVQEMAKIQCPVLIIYFNADIVYPLEGCQALQEELRAAGVSASLLVADGSHYGCLLSASQVNAPVQQFIESCLSDDEPELYSSTPMVVTAERVCGDSMKTPFHHLFAKVGYDPAYD